MTPTEPTKPMLRLANHARFLAAQAGAYNGVPTQANQVLLRRLSHLFHHGEDVTARLIFSRDAGMHSGGWWKNPDYERCEHLSVSFVDRETREHAPQDHARARLWCLAFFEEAARLLWVEPPFSDVGKQRDVYHYRLFLAPDWRTPLLPRGEVYDREFIEMGWRSWSEQHGVPGIGDDRPP